MQNMNNLTLERKVIWICIDMMSKPTKANNKEKFVKKFVINKLSNSSKYGHHSIQMVTPF